MQCPRCGSGVPANKTECQVCGASLTAASTPESAAPSAPAAPVPTAPGIPGASAGASPVGGGIPGLQPATAPGLEPGGIPGLRASAPESVGMGGGQARMSLTGEILEAAPPPSKNVPGAIGPPPSARPGGHGAPPASKSRIRPTYEEDAQPKGAPLGAIIFFVLLLIGGGAFGGWWWYNHRTNPKDQALKVYTAMFKDQDFKALYPLVAFNEEDKKKYPDADAFAKDMEKAKPVLSSVSSMMTDFTTGEAKIDGNKATVPTSSKVQGRNMKGSMDMILEKGVWKWDTTANDKSASLKALTNLIGKPE